MQKYNGIIIVSDVDGTLISHVNPDAYKINSKAIEKFKSGGGIFTIATGRVLSSLENVVPVVKELVNAPIVLANGAVLYDFRKDVYLEDIHLDNKKFKEFVAIVVEKFPDVGIRINCGNEFLTPVINDALRADAEDWWELIREKPLSEISDNMNKCVFASSPQTLEKLREFANEFDTDNNFYMSKSYETGLEFVNSKSTKGTMLDMLKTHLGLPDHKIYAIGDYDNDYDMICRADFGAAPQNAQPHVYAAAKIHTCHCDDGAIAYLIDCI